MRIVRGGLLFPMVVLALGWGLVGCGGENASGDAGSGIDGGGADLFDSGGLDSGPLGDDGGPDATLPRDDAGPAEVDAGPMYDAGPAPLDAGPMFDAGPDAGAMMDATVGVDAGMDAGTDAGFDSGPPAMCLTDEDCSPRIACTSPTRLTTQTYTCTGGFCIEDPPMSVDCAAGDSDLCSGDSVVATRGTCDGATQACETSTTTTACAAPACDASRDYVTETCSVGRCVASTEACNAGPTTTCRRAIRFQTVRDCRGSVGCTAATGSTACTADSPACVPGPRGLTSYETYTPACNAGGTDCESGGVVETSTLCLAPTNSCSRGRLTSHTATCGSRGCGSTSSTSTCETSPNECGAPAGGGLSHTTYAPSCASRSSCSSTGTATVTGCRTTSPTCSRRGQYTTFTATCDLATGCGESSSTDDCADYDTCTANTWSVRYGGPGCTTRGCNGAEQSLSCVAGGTMCMSSTVSVSCTPGGSCRRGRCSRCTPTTCRSGCDPSTGRCSIRRL